MTRRKLFSLIPAGLLTAIVPSFLKKKEIDPGSWRYPTVPSEPYTRTAWMEERTNDDTTGCWELCSIDKEGKVNYGLSDMRFRTLAEGWAWIDLLVIVERIPREQKYWKLGLWHCIHPWAVIDGDVAHKNQWHTYWEFETKQEAEDFKASLRLLGNADKRNV